jgi:D-glycero-D-manno-heptose 1,7-bisphosphate phosphatase
LKKEKKIFIFDRDGVLIKNYGYVFEKKNLKWLKGAISAIKFLNKKRIFICVVTNQSGISRGYFTKKDLEIFHKFMQKTLYRNKCYIDKIYYCPFYKEGIIKKYRKDSFDRKPNPGMILKALRDFKVKKKNAYMIGDNKIDYLAAKKSGIKFQYKKKISLYKQVADIIKFLCLIMIL